MNRASGPDPFLALGLPARPELTDDDVRAAWRRVSAASHPDRADGGDPDRFAAAAAAYTTLRTASGRGEALADLSGRRGRAGWPARIWQGRPARLALRLAVAAVVSALAITVAGAAPATPAVITGAITWLLVTGRHDLAPSP